MHWREIMEMTSALTQDIDIGTKMHVRFSSKVAEVNMQHEAYRGDMPWSYA